MAANLAEHSGGICSLRDPAKEKIKPLGTFHIKEVARHENSNFTSERRLPGWQKPVTHQLRKELGKHTCF